MAQRTFPAAISRRAITISRLSDCMSGLAPFKSCFARMDASSTRSKRLEPFPKQSSTVILAMTITVGHGVVEHKVDVPRLFAVCPVLSAAFSLIVSDPTELLGNGEPALGLIYFSPRRARARVSCRGDRRSPSHAPGREQEIYQRRRRRGWRSARKSEGVNSLMAASA